MVQSIQEMEDPIFINECEMNILDQFTTQQMEVALGEELLHSLSSESYCSHPPFTPRSYNTFSCTDSMGTSLTGEVERPTKRIVTSSWNESTTDQLSAPDTSSPTIISFCQPNSPSNHQHFYGGFFMLKEDSVSTRTLVTPGDSSISLVNQSHVSKASLQGAKRVSAASAKPPSYAQDHIIAERKRREKLSQRFIALSAVLPGLKKVHSCSINQI